MLTELKVSHFAIIDRIHIHFEEGLNILSGETGAGKSILIKSLGLLMGAKSSSQDIRSGCETATIQGAFDLSDRQDIREKLEEMGIETPDQNLIVRRLVQKNGKSRIYLNGALSTVSDLRTVVFPLVTISNPTDAPLIEITGQHENKDLLSSRYQMDTLDQFCGSLKERLQVEELYQEIKSIEREMAELERLSHAREQQIDFLKFQIDEIEGLDLQPGEDELLMEQIKSIKEKGKWQLWFQEASDVLTGDRQSILGQLKTMLAQAPDSQNLKKIKEQLREAYVTLEDVAFELQKQGDSELETEIPLEDLEDRLSRLRKLQKKFGASIADIESSLLAMKAEYQKLTHLSETLDGLEAQKNQVLKKLTKACESLSTKRKAGAGLLANEVNEELKDLNMKGLQFLVEVERTDQIQSTGWDMVVFKTKTGARDEARELARTASGGELSRILLSLKQVTGASQHPRTFLFDEVDTGVSGPTAEKVGAKLKNIAHHQQVICVTHLPQVASFGDHHFYIEKQPTKDTVEMSVKKLKPEERVHEIARLISGEKVTKTSLAHAKQLLSL